MLSTMILALAMTAQAPAPHNGPKTDAELRVIMREINARVAIINAMQAKNDAQRMQDRAAQKARDKAALAAAPKKPEPVVEPEPAAAVAPAPPKQTEVWVPITDRKERLRAQVAAQERAQAEAVRRYQIEAQAQYERMLPYMLEQQRQQLMRQGEMERNQALHRMAAAQEYEAQYYAWWVSKQRAR